MAKLIHEVKIISGLTDEMKAQGWKKVEPKNEKWAYEQIQKAQIKDKDAAPFVGSEVNVISGKPKTK